MKKIKGWGKWGRRIVKKERKEGDGQKNEGEMGEPLEKRGG